MDNPSAKSILEQLVKTAASRRRVGLADDQVLKKLSKMHQPKPPEPKA